MNAYFAATSEVDGKYYAHEISINESQNVISYLQTYPRLVFVNYCSTKKKMNRIIDAWNQSYRDNGTYAF